MAIVLADLHGSFPYFHGLRRWIWEKRLTHSRYNEVEAMQLLEAAVQRIQQGKVLELHIALALAKMQAVFDAKDGINDTLRELYEHKLKTWKGE